MAVNLPTMITVLIGILINNARLSDMNGRINDLNTRLTSELATVNLRIDDLRTHFDARFDEMRATWTAELHRVEGVLDARLKHLEER